MATSNEFQSMGLSVFPSQDREIIISKQPVLAEYGASVRSVINMLPPDASKALLAEYGQPVPGLVQRVQAAIIEREYMVENAEKGASLDREWAQGGGAARRMDEIGLSAEDDWNTPPAP